MPETTGQKLKSARIALGLNVGQAAQATHIRERFLEAIEADRLDQLPSLTQGRGFIRLYANYLGVDLNPAPTAPSESSPHASSALETDSAADLQPADVENGSKATPPRPVDGPTAAVPRPQSLHPAGGAHLPTQSEMQFREMGRKLAAQRKLLNLSLEEVERFTHVRSHYLKALEEGRIDDLPSTVQGRGMLINYARFISLDSEALLLEFAAGIQSRRTERMDSAATRPPAPKIVGLPVLRFISVDLLLGATVVVMLSAFIIWGAASVITAQRPDVKPTLPGLSELLIATPSLTVTPSPANASPQPTGTLAVVIGSGQDSTTPMVLVPTLGAEPVQVYILARQRAWMKVTVDGKATFLGRTLPGAKYTYAGQRTVQVQTGNGAALQLYFNQRDMGLLGINSQVIDITYTASGPMNPTATLTPVPSATPTSTPTPKPTSNLPPTSTPPPP